MPSKVVEEIVEDIDQPELGNVSLDDPAAADAALVAAAKSGDGRAFEILVGRHERSEERRVGKECRSRWSPYH